MPGNGERSGCDPGTLIPDHPRTHSLLYDRFAFFDEGRRKVVYLHDDEIHENCEHGHTHRSKICLTHEFTKVAAPEEDCSLRKDCHIHIRKDGAAELHHPADAKTKDKKCVTVAVLKPLT